MPCEDLQMKTVYMEIDLFTYFCIFFLSRKVNPKVASNYQSNFIYIASFTILKPPPIPSGSARERPTGMETNVSTLTETSWLTPHL